MEIFAVSSGKYLSPLAAKISKHVDSRFGAQEAQIPRVGPWN